MIDERHQPDRARRCGASVGPLIASSSSGRSAHAGALVGRQRRDQLARPAARPARVRVGGQPRHEHERPLAPHADAAASARDRRCARRRRRPRPRPACARPTARRASGRRPARRRAPASSQSRGDGRRVGREHHRVQVVLLRHRTPRRGLVHRRHRDQPWAQRVDRALQLRQPITEIRADRQHSGASLALARCAQSVTGDIARTCSGIGACGLCTVTVAASTRGSARHTSASRCGERLEQVHRLAADHLGQRVASSP